MSTEASELTAGMQGGAAPTARIPGAAARSRQPGGQATRPAGAPPRQPGRGRAGGPAVTPGTPGPRRGRPAPGAVRQRLDQGRRRLRTTFSLPAAGDADPGPRQLILLSVWGVALSMVGIICAIWVLIRIYAVKADWFAPTVVIIGLGGILLTIGAFFLIQHERVSRILMGCATGALMTVILVTLVTG